MATIGFSAKEDRMAKVLMLTGDGGESLEVMYPYQRHLEAGHEATIAAPSAS
jgi:protease I